MARDKSDEHFEREYERSITLGFENAEYIRHGQNWCQHMRIEMVSYGLFAQTTGLPIGSHALSCQFAKGLTESMNLSWIVPDFILENCIDCSDHLPGSDISWAEKIIAEHKERILEHKKEKETREFQLRSLKERLRELSNNARETSEIDEMEILVFLEQIFSDDPDVQNEASKLLYQAAQIGADLFPDIAIDILLQQSLSVEFASLCLPVCTELAGRRDDLAKRFENLAIEAIENQLLVETAALILLRLDENVKYPLTSDVIQKLISFQVYGRPVGGWPGEPPRYTNSVELLGEMYDIAPDSVLAPIQALLEEDDKYVRINACGVLGELQSSRPQIAISLLPDLVTALDLYDDPYGNSADGRIRQRIAKAFDTDAEYVDDYLCSVIKHKRLPVQQEIVAIYREVVWQRIDRDKHPISKSDVVPKAVMVATNRCLEFVKDESFEPEVRLRAAEVLEHVASKFPTALLPKFELLLGYYAIICGEEEEPSSAPQIILPGQDDQDIPRDHVDQFRRVQTWRHYRRKFVDVLKNLVKQEPAFTVRFLIECYENLETKSNERFKSDLITLLGELGRDFSFQSRVLPLIFNGLMDFDSQLLRADSIHTVREMYRNSKSNPPQNIVDILLLHLRDSYVIVHKAAIDVLRWNAHWLTEAQAREVMRIILSWIPAYSNDPYYLRDLYHTILRVSSRHDSLRTIGIGIVARSSPTNQKLVDEELGESLARYTVPSEPGAELVGIWIARCLSNYHERFRDSHYYYGARARMFNWLQKMPYRVYIRVRPNLEEAANRLAMNDAWESCQFACIFARHEDYLQEANVLEIAVNSTGEEKSYEKLHKKLLALHSAAIANYHLRTGESTEVLRLMENVLESEK